MKDEINCSYNGGGVVYLLQSELSTSTRQYVRTGINTYLENQVENHSKIGNSVNNQKPKISKSNFSKAWREKGDNMLDIMIQTSILLLLHIIIKRVGTRESNLSLLNLGIT